jgi:prophage antirepressor-like protein
MLETEEIEVPFLENTKMTKIKSLKFNNRFLFTSTDVLKVLQYVNFSSARRDSKLIEGKDYIVLERKAQSEVLWQELEDLNLVARRSARITLVYESGFWKMCLCSTKTNKNIIEWISSEVLPSIAREGVYNFFKYREEKVSETYIVKDTITNTYKIGKSKDIKCRLSSLKSSNLNLELVLTLDGDFEKELHNKYIDKHIDREWYSLTEQDVIDIQKSQEDIIKYNIDNCKQVTGSTPIQVKKAYGRPSKSAKEVLREFNPAAAMTMSINDYFVVKQNKDLEMLKDLDTHLLNTFNEMLKIGITLKDE